MQVYVTDVVDGIATEVVESEQFNDMVTKLIKESDIVISTDPL